MTDFDVIVLGGGLSGTQAALRAAELGGKVCLIEKEKVGKRGFLKRKILFTKWRYGNGNESIKWSEQLEKQERLAEEYYNGLTKSWKRQELFWLRERGAWLAQMRYWFRKLIKVNF